jgi:hypothetical protein
MADACISARRAGTPMRGAVGTGPIRAVQCGMATAAPMGPIPTLVTPTTSRLNYGRLNVERLNVAGSVFMPDPTGGGGRVASGGLGDRTITIQLGYGIP